MYVLLPVEQYQGPSIPINNEIGEGRGDKNDDQNQRKLALAMKHVSLSADTPFWQMSIYIDIDDVYHPTNERQLILFKSG